MLLSFVEIFGLVCGVCAGIGIAGAVASGIRGVAKHEGYNTAVRDIMRYGYYMKNGERHEVENIRIWSD